MCDRARSESGGDQTNAVGVARFPLHSASGGPRRLSSVDLEPSPKQQEVGECARSLRRALADSPRRECLPHSRELSRQRLGHYATFSRTATATKCCVSRGESDTFSAKRRKSCSVVACRSF